MTSTLGQILVVITGKEVLQFHTSKSSWISTDAVVVVLSLQWFWPSCVQQQQQPHRAQGHRQDENCYRNDNCHVSCSFMKKLIYKKLDIQ